MKIRIGVHVDERLDALAATLNALEAYDGGQAAEIWLLLEADAPRIPQTTVQRVRRVVQSHDRGGAPACFNLLVADADADLYVFLENGLRVGPGWLNRMQAALARDVTYGLAGPSTNVAWNEQGALPCGGTDVEVARAAETALTRFGDEVATLEPLYSLGGFCFAVTRATVDAIGYADVAYGRGPCWEMDYNIRAARVGISGVWVKSAFVWRGPPSSSRAVHEQRHFERSKRLYQDRFCGLRLQGGEGPYHVHCQGEVCPHFAPPDRLKTTIHNRAVEAVSIVPVAAPPAHRPVPQQPLVSCIMPTFDRRPYVTLAIEDFLQQTYEPRELIILDDGSESIADLVPADTRIHYHREAHRTSLGAKRNRAARLARGDVLIHWDDDDWHAPWRIEYQVHALLEQGAEICGTRSLRFFDGRNLRAWHYHYPGSGAWLAGGTFCYKRSLLQQHGFSDVTIGEDTRFIHKIPEHAIAVLDRDDFYVARVHNGNTSAKQTASDCWHDLPLGNVRVVMGAAFLRWCEVQGGTPDRDAPLVSCTMPTYNRQPFVPLALACFDAQDYGNRELIVVDDSDQAIEDLVADHPGVKYFRLPRRESIGFKRNFACEQAQGEIILHWDDDDWYSPGRLRSQAEPIINNVADITGIEGRYYMTVPGGQFWEISRALHRRMYFGDVHGGTLGFRRSAWAEGVRYPSCSLGEDAAWLQQAVGRGNRLQRIDNEGLFVYTRHGTNAWAFETGGFIDRTAWTESAPPPNMTAATINRYLRAAALMQ